MRKCLKINMFWIRKLIQTSNQIWLTNDFTNQHPKWFCIRKLIQKSITPNAKKFEKSTCFETKNELSFWIWYSFYVFHFLEEEKLCASSFWNTYLGLIWVSSCDAWSSFKSLLYPLDWPYRWFSFIHFYFSVLGLS